MLSVTKTDENGRYSFATLLPGSYNAVCAYNDKTAIKAAVIDCPVDVFQFVVIISYGHTFVTLALQN